MVRALIQFAKIFEALSNLQPILRVCHDLLHPCTHRFCNNFPVRFFAEKFLNIAIERIGTSFARHKVDKFQAEDHPDILLIAEGVPYFERLRLQNSEVNIFLRYPIEIIPTEDQDQYSSVDIGLNSLSLPNISNAAFNEALELARVEVATAFANRQDGAYFNGKQYGVRSLDGFSRTIDG